MPLPELRYVQVVKQYRWRRLVGVRHRIVFGTRVAMQQVLAPPADSRHGLGQKWRPQIPAMAAGLTDHAWTLREALMFSIPLWPQPQAL